MAHQLVKEKISLDQTIGRESTQILLEGDMIVPDVKPDMALLLQTDAKIAIERAEVSTDRVNFIGKLDLQALYIAKGQEKSVHSMSLSAPVDDFINMDGVTKDMWVQAKAELVNIDYKMLNDRKINYRAVVSVTVTAERSDTKDVVVHIQDIPENQLLKSHLSLSRTVEHKQDIFIVKDQMSVPSGKPNIREVLQCAVRIANKDARLAAGRVTITGELSVTTLYRTENGESMIEFVEHEIPFNGTVDVPGARDDMYADVSLAVRDQYIKITPDADGEDRVLDAEISIAVALKVVSGENLEILEDAYCINQQLEVECAPIQYPRLVCRNRNQSPVKEVVQIDGQCPDILQIFRVKGDPHIDEIKVIDDKIIVEGVIAADVLYVAENDDTPLYSYKTVIPFRQVIETKGSKPDMRVNVDVSVDHIAFNMLSRRETELRFLLTFNTQVLEEKKVSIIQDIAFSEMERSVVENMASITVYVVQPGDSLWKIAKKYNTGIDELAAVNELENPNKIVPGQKLLILKRVV